MSSLITCLLRQCLQPAIFNGPEISMPRDNIHYGGWEHRDLHNINGMLFVRATSVYSPWHLLTAV